MSEAQKKMLRFQFIYIIISFGMIIVISNNSLRVAIGGAANDFLGPVIGFNGVYPLLTLVLSGILIGIITSVPRYFFTDWVKMGKMQLHTRAYSKALREAYRANDHQKIQKLRKKQMEVTMESQQISMNTMKPLMILTVFTLLIFIWLDVYIYEIPYKLISVPWAVGINIAKSKFLISFIPSWIALYMIASLVFGYLATMVIKWIDFSYRLKKYEEEE